jgi:7-cyano-7-deazaguanine synthase
MKSVVVLSGGQDSTTTLAVAAKESEVVGLVHFDYGQRHLIERECAQWWADRYGLPLTVLEVPAFSQIGNSALVDGSDIGGQHPNLKNLPASFVPGRNLVFLTLASAFAMKVGASEVYTGVCQTDYSGYPDCRATNLLMLQQALRGGMEFPLLKFKWPIMYLSKAQTFLLAEHHGVLEDVVEHSHTCYTGDRTKHDWGYGCGECPACQVRARGWEQFMGLERQ